MKRKTAIVLSIILAVLIIPVPTGIYKDGGTKTYTALTYKIVDWKRISANGTYEKLKVYPFPMNFMSLSSLFEREEEKLGQTNTFTLQEEILLGENDIGGYCGNTLTTVYFEDGKKHTFMAGNSVALTDILRRLDYDPNKNCKCLPEYTVDTEFGIGYGISLRSEHGYVRCDKGQAELGGQQYETVKKIIDWAKEQAE